MKTTLRQYFLSCFFAVFVLVGSCPGAGSLYQMLLSRPNASAPSGDITSNLSLWWKFDDNTGTTATDNGSSSRNGTFANDSANDFFSTDPDWDASNKMIGTSCLIFSSGGEANWVRHTTTWDLSGSITIACWVKQSGTDLNGSIFTVYDSTHSLGIGFKHGDGTSGSRLNVVNSTFGTGKLVTTMSTGTWYHLAVTYSAGVIQTIYFNGASTAGTTTNVAATTTTGVFVGNDSAVPSARGFKGSVDDVRIYDRILSATDITALYAYR